MQCAVSGGADSLALMLLAHAAGLNVTAVHIDHGLRHDSSLDKDVIQPIADSLGITVQIHSVRIEDGPNLEAS